MTCIPIEHTHIPKLAPLSLTLIVTEYCNLDCTYCFVKKKSGRVMSRDVAYKAVEKYLNSDSSEYDQVLIDFSGGEPLANFDLIRDVVEYVTSEKWLKPFSFSIGTNGTLVTPEIREWSTAHPCVSFSLSLDGETAQNINRSDSYELVSRNFAFFRKWTDTKVKMTIGPQSIAHIFESIQSIHANGFSIAPNVVFEDVWGDKKAEYLRAFWRELDKLIDFYLENRGCSFRCHPLPAGKGTQILRIRFAYGNV